MTSKRKPYKTFTREFKLEAIRMMNESDRLSSEIATQLSIRCNQLYKQKEQLEAIINGVSDVDFDIILYFNDSAPIDFVSI